MRYVKLHYEESVIYRGRLIDLFPSPTAVGGINGALLVSKTRVSRYNGRGGRSLSEFFFNDIVRGMNRRYISTD
jgi:hypothetical protein